MQFSNRKSLIGDEKTAQDVRASRTVAVAGTSVPVPSYVANGKVRECHAAVKFIVDHRVQWHRQPHGPECVV